LPNTAARFSGGVTSAILAKAVEMLDDVMPYHAADEQPPQ
jgi:hypothetical protein